MKGNWSYNYKIGDAGLPSRPPRFKDLGEHSIEIFVRELIQNSLDARLDDSKPVSINFKVEELDKSDINKFFELIGSDYLAAFKKSYEYERAIIDVKAKMHPGIQLIDGKQEKSFSLTIEENNCVGLTGPVRGKKSNFDSLIRKTDDNQEKKESLSNSGGTWGKGSSIFVYSSDLWMWFCHTLLSKPEVNVSSPTEYTRFIGRAIISPFYEESANKGYFGDTWFCEKNSIDAYPYVNEKANSFAEIFGLPKRVSPGCTFYIPFFNTFLADPKLTNVVEEFRNQVLKNWFIPIYNGDLEVSISDEGNTIYKIDKDYLKNVNQLKFKLEILDWRSNGCPPDERFIWESYEIDVPALKKEYVILNNKFAAKKQKVKFDLVIRKLDEDEDFDKSWDTENKVYLTRNRGMLVDNFTVPIDLKDIRTESILFTGLSSLSETDSDKKSHLDLFLAYSENPAHNKWCTSHNDYDSCFLDFFEGTKPLPETQIGKIFIEIERSFKELFEEEKKPETSKDICSIFKKIAKLRITGGAGGSRSLYSMRTPSNVTNPIFDEDGRFIFTYLIKSNHTSPIEISFRPLLKSLEGETDKDFDLLGIPDFKNLILKDEYDDIILDQDLILNPQEEKLIEIKTCKIWGVPEFKNLETIIKSTAKEYINERADN